MDAVALAQSAAGCENNQLKIQLGSDAHDTYTLEGHVGGDCRDCIVAIRNSWASNGVGCCDCRDQC